VILISTDWPSRDEKTKIEIECTLLIRALLDYVARYKFMYVCM